MATIDSGMTTNRTAILVMTANGKVLSTSEGSPKGVTLSTHYGTPDEYHLPVPIETVSRDELVEVAPWPHSSILSPPCRRLLSGWSSSTTRTATPSSLAVPL
jgi:hypothetical protein